MTDQFPTLDVAVKEISPSTLKQRLDDGVQLTILDTRRPEDFESWKLTHPNLRNVNVPFTEFLDNGEPAASVPEGVPREPLVTCCAKGISSHYVAEFLAREGWDVEALDDGMRGWAELYERRELDRGDTGGATVSQYVRPSSGCLAYLVVSGEQAAVIDPLRAFTDRYLADVDAAGAELVYAIDTHVHADHLSGVRKLGARSAAEIVMPAGTTNRGLAFEETPDKDQIRLIEDGDSLDIGSTTIDAVGLAGHTTEMMGYRLGSVLFTGDTVFIDGVARPDLEDPDRAREAAGTLYDTLQWIDSLPDETVIAPGHAGPETPPGDDGTYVDGLDRLRSRLDAFDMDRDGFVEYVLDDMPPRPNNYETIIDTNLGRSSVGDTEAFELELGPNNCAVGESAHSAD